jgi:hypothetical protein
MVLDQAIRKLIPYSVSVTYGEIIGVALAGRLLCLGYNKSDGSVAIRPGFWNPPVLRRIHLYKGCNNPVDGVPARKFWGRAGQTFPGNDASTAASLLSTSPSAVSHVGTAGLKAEYSDSCS